MVHIRLIGVVSVNLMSISLAFVFMLYRALAGAIVSPVSVVVCILRPATGIVFWTKVLLGRLGAWWGGRVLCLTSSMSSGVKARLVSLWVRLKWTVLVGAFRPLFIRVRVVFSLVVASPV